MDKFTHEDWQRIAVAFSKLQPGDEKWVHIVDAILTYLLQDKLAQTDRR